MNRLEVIDISDNCTLEDVVFGKVNIDKFCENVVAELNKQIGYEMNLWSGQSPSVIKRE